jgi:hypothetical protein
MASNAVRRRACLPEEASGMDENVSFPSGSAMYWSNQPWGWALVVEPCDSFEPI